MSPSRNSPACSSAHDAGERQGESLRRVVDIGDPRLHIAADVHAGLRLDRRLHGSGHRLRLREQSEAESGRGDQDQRQTRPRRQPVRGQEAGDGEALAPGTEPPEGGDDDAGTQGHGAGEEQDREHEQEHARRLGAERLVDDDGTSIPQAVEDEDGSGDRQDLPREPGQDAEAAPVVLRLTEEGDGRHDADRDRADHPGDPTGSKGSVRRVRAGPPVGSHRSDEDEPDRQARDDAEQARDGRLEHGAGPDGCRPGSACEQQGRLDAASSHRERTRCRDHGERHQDPRGSEQPGRALDGRNAPLHLGDDLVDRAPVDRPTAPAEPQQEAPVEQPPGLGGPVAHLFDDAGGPCLRVHGLVQGQVGLERRLPGDRESIHPQLLRDPQEPVPADDDRLRGRCAVGTVDDQLVVPGPPEPGDPALVEGAVDAVDVDRRGAPVLLGEGDLVARPDPESLGEQVRDQRARAGSALEDLDVRGHIVTGEQANHAGVARFVRGESLDRKREVAATAVSARYGFEADQVAEPPVDPLDGVGEGLGTGEGQRSVPIGEAGAPTRHDRVAHVVGQELARRRRDEQGIGGGREREQCAPRRRSRRTAPGTGAAGRGPSPRAGSPWGSAGHGPGQARGWSFLVPSAACCT